MPTRTCDMCNQVQTLKGKVRSTTCHDCTMRHKPKRLGTGKGWHIHKGTGYIIGREEGRQYYQHRYVMECHLGRKLEKEESVHHINGNREDNRIENLEVISASEHGLHHSEYRIRNSLGQFTGGK